MQLAVVVEVVLAVELVLPAELARETIRSFTVKGLLVTLEVLISSESLVAARVIALTHGSSNHVNLRRVRLDGSLLR